MKFVKMQGAGNDFIVLEANAAAYDWSRLALAICDRHYGIGADGLLMLAPSTVADFRMRIFNSDGSEAEACGNGLRCLVRYFVDRKSGNFRDQALNPVRDGEISVETVGGIRKVQVHRMNDKLTKVKAGMGEPRFDAKDIPVRLECGGGRVITRKPMMTYAVQVDGWELPLALVSVGNSHAIYFSDKSVFEFPLSQVGPKVERHPMFPRGVNFEVARVVNRSQIEVSVWERGVGETFACGSGACAVTVAARLNGYIDDRVAVKLPGGVLEVEWTGAGEVFLSGPAETVFVGEWLEDHLGW